MLKWKSVKSFAIFCNLDVNVGVLTLKVAILDFPCRS